MSSLLQLWSFSKRQAISWDLLLQLSSISLTLSSEVSANSLLLKPPWLPSPCFLWAWLPCFLWGPTSYFDFQLKEASNWVSESRPHNNGASRYPLVDCSTTLNLSFGLAAPPLPALASFSSSKIPSQVYLCSYLEPEASVASLAAFGTWAHSGLVNSFELSPPRPQALFAGLGTPLSLVICHWSVGWRQQAQLAFASCWVARSRWQTSWGPCFDLWVSIDVSLGERTLFGYRWG